MLRIAYDLPMDHEFSSGDLWGIILKKYMSAGYSAVMVLKPA
jgi:hypothetical protein